MVKSNAAALFLFAFAASAQPARQLRTYVAPNRLYALQKPADWKVTETSQASFFRIVVDSPDGGSRVDFGWSRSAQNSNLLRYVVNYRQFLARTCPDLVFRSVRASQNGAHAVAEVAFQAGGVAKRGKYYFEAGPRGYSAQGFFAPETQLASQRALLLNVMASLSFLRNDPRPAASGAEATYYKPQLVPRRAQDGSLSVRIPADWEFLAAGGKIVTGAKGGPGFLFTSLQGNPMLPGAPVSQGIIGSRYLPPPRTLVWLLEAFGHRNVRVESAQPDPQTTQQLMATVHRQADVQDIVAHWVSPAGAPLAGSFKVMNALPSATGMWFTIVSGVWAPERDTAAYLPMLEEVAASFQIDDAYAREYIRAGLERLRRLQAQTAAAISDLNRAREQNQRDWEERQRRKEFSDSKWDDYRRGQSYWVSDLEGGKVYATDSWGTRDTATGDYYEGRGYNWVNFEGENPRYAESMREISSYELKQMER